MKGVSGIIRYGQHTITYQLLYVARKTMEIAVHPDAAVIVKAPVGTTDTAVQTKLRKRARWILRQRAYFKQFTPRTPGRQFITGAAHSYLGRHYRLKISIGNSDSVKLAGAFFYISHRKNGPEPKALMQTWYHKKAGQQFSASLDRCWAAFQNLKLKKPALNIRLMKKRWGSLSVKGRMTLNVDLVRAPCECIDYVVTHELCHLVHKDHGLPFYRLLEGKMPDWTARKHKLEIKTA